MEVEVEVKIDSKILYDYMLRHTYNSLQGILGTAAGGIMIFSFIKTGYILWLIFGIVLLLYLPWSLFLRSRQQMINIPAFREPLHYRLTEEGVEISQNGEKQFQKWEHMVKAVSTGKSIILYTSRISASIFPRKDLGDKQEMVIKMISTHMDPKKVKIRM